MIIAVILTVLALLGIYIFGEPLLSEARKVVVSSLTPTPTLTPASTSTLTATSTPTATLTPRPAATSTPTVLSPHLRHLEHKEHMLDLINAERVQDGKVRLILGDNIAAQLHAEDALRNCFSGHWGLDGLKPYMRYSLAGGYQSNGENGRGLDYCIKPSDNFRPLGDIQQEIRDAVIGWMESPGHRRNILDPTHKKVNIGLAWDRYNLMAFQHFEGDYVEYDELPSIQGTVLFLSGRVKNGVKFSSRADLGVQVYYDPPVHPLTRGQVTRTYCYNYGRQIAMLSQPGRWATDESTASHHPCPNPYDVPPSAPAPQSAHAADRFWEEAYRASNALSSQSITVPWVTASEWKASGTEFSVTANMGDMRPGVYTVVLWAPLGGMDSVISEYSIFHEVTPPTTYSRQ